MKMNYNYETNLYNIEQGVILVLYPYHDLGYSDGIVFYVVREIKRNKDVFLAISLNVPEYDTAYLKIQFEENNILVSNSLNFSEEIAEQHEVKDIIDSDYWEVCVTR